MNTSNPNKSYKWNILSVSTVSDNTPLCLEFGPSVNISLWEGFEFLFRSWVKKSEDALKYNIDPRPHKLKGINTQLNRTQ